MSPVSDLKVRVEALEAAGKIAEALAFLRDALTRLEGTPAFLRELPLLVKAGDFETRLGNTAAALVCYERAIAAYVKHGKADSVIATALRIARLRPQAGALFNYPLQLKGFGHTDAARHVLMALARRTDHPAEADELESLAGAPESEVAAAVDRIVGMISGRATARRTSSAMSLEDAIGAMRRKAGIAERAHVESELPPPPPAPAPKPRRMVLALLVMALVAAAGGLVWTSYQAPNLTGPPTVFEPPAPSAPRPSPPVEESATASVPRGAPPPPERVGLTRPMVGVGLLAAESSTVAVLPRAITPDSVDPHGDGVPAAMADVPRLPTGALVTRSVVAVRGLAISRIDDAGRGFRLVQPLSDLTNLELILSPGGAAATEPVVTSVEGGAAGTRQFHGYLVRARAPVSADSLARLLLRLVEIPPRQ